jgi:hypothetical protein
MMADAHNERRVCVFSQRLVRPHVALCNAFEFEDVVCELESADLLVAKPVSRFEQYAHLFRVISRHTPFNVSPRRAVPPVAVDKAYDLFIYSALSPADLGLLRRCRGWRERSRIAICYVEEIWKSWLERYSGPSSPIQILKEFDHVFLNCRGTVSMLQSVIGRPCHYIAPASDTIRFYPSRGQRGIDVYYMGRRAALTHRALMGLADTGKISYLYDSQTGLEVQDVQEHRKLLAGTLGNTRYFIVHTAKANRQDHTAGQEELGFRFFEGAAGGTVMIGSPPRVDTFATHFDWADAVVEMPYDTEGIRDLIADLDDQPDRVNRIRRDNVVNSLRRHDWVHRWSTILETVGMNQVPAMTRRQARLKELASNTDAAAFSEVCG